MILHVQLIHAVIHLIYRLSYVIGIAVGCNEMKLRDVKFGAELINILFSVKLEDIPRIGEGIKRFGIQHTFFDNVVDLTADKAI